MASMSNRDSEFYSPMPRIIGTILVVSLVLCGLMAWGCQRAGKDWMLSAAITFGTTAFHIALRLVTPVILWAFSRKKYDYHSWWFREKNWEPGFYKRLDVKHWKVKAFTYDPREFSMKLHSFEEIANNMCHAELVHELIAVFGFTSLLFAIPFGAFGVFLVTAVLAALFDLSFVVLQRYNRPRIVRLIEKGAERAAKPAK